jgi:antitoxin (DNA-binding transcriptional repressor) of toxin-antitoxin stability system
MQVMSKKLYKMADAKTHLATLVREALAGSDVTIARGHQPLVRLIPVAQPDALSRRTSGDLAGEVSIPDAFFAPVNPDVAEEWGL